MDSLGIFRRWSRMALAAAGAAALLLLGTLAVRGSGSRGAWLTRDLQVVNLDPAPQEIVVHFYNRSGAQVYVLTDTLPAGGARFYSPPGYHFSGTVFLDSPAQTAMGILHLDEGGVYYHEGGWAGSSVFPGAPDEQLSTTAYVPVDDCVLLSIHNPDPGQVADVAINLFDLVGTASGVVQRIVPPLGTVLVPPVQSAHGFLGSTVVNTSLPVQVTVLHTCHGVGAYLAPTYGDFLLLAPRVPPMEPGVVTTTLTIQNTSAMTALVNITYSSGLTDSVSLEPLGTAILPSPFGGEVGSALIASARRVVAVVRTVRKDGLYTYRAVALGSEPEATPAVALPVLLGGFEGWHTGARIWVRNLGGEATEARIRYVTAPTGTVYWDRGIMGPGDALTFTMPYLTDGASRASAIVLADQPIVALAGAFNIAVPSMRDRQIRYQGANFDFECSDPVTGVNFTVEPPTPTARLPVTFSAWASGMEPISYMWDFGDMSTGSGVTATHRYFWPGTYTVTLTAANCLGFEEQEVARLVDVAPGWTVYLPLLFRSW